MRNSIVLLAAVLALSCGSSAPSPRHMRLQVTELRQPGMQTMINGTHFYRIRIMNDGTEAFSVDTITIQASGAVDLEIMNGMQKFQENVAPGETVPFDMAVDVQVSRANLSVNRPIEALRIVISASGPSGSFFESGDYPVTVEIGG